MCGEERYIDEFRTQVRRNYKNECRSTYRRPYCKACEAIECRRRYLVDMTSPSPEHEQELNQINELYELRLAKGLKTFDTNRRNKPTIATEVSKQLEALRNK